MKKIMYLGLIALLVLPAGAVWAQYDITELSSDMTAVVKGVSQLFGENLGGMSYIGDPVGTSFIKNFTVGAGGGAVLVPVSNLDFSTGTTMDIDFGSLKYIPIPVVGAYGKFSLKRLEIGGKIAGFPEYSSKEFQVRNLIIGGKVRYKLANFNLRLIKGGLSVGGLYEFMNGGLMIADSDGYPIFYDTGGGEVQVGNAMTSAAFDTSWQSHTFGGEAQANMQLLFFNIFLGSRVSKTFGKATTDFAGDVTLSLLSPAMDPFVNQGTYPIAQITEATKAGGVDLYGFGGMEFKLLFFTLGARGSYNFTNKNLVFDGGLRVQF